MLPPLLASNTPNSVMLALAVARIVPVILSVSPATFSVVCDVVPNIRDCAGAARSVDAAVCPDPVPNCRYCGRDASAAHTVITLDRPELVTNAISLPTPGVCHLCE